MVLLLILALLLFALWYDYKVARPAVDQAFETIAKYNSEVNSSAGRKYLTDKDVQEKLQRTPSDSYIEGVYQIEVYSWRSGLPIRSHNYYAVYSAGTPLVFLKHFKFTLPKDELKLDSDVVLTTNDTSTPDSPPDGGGTQRKDGPKSESADTEPKLELKPLTPGAEAPSATEPPAKDKPAADAPAETKTETKATEPKSGESKAGEAKASETPAKESAPATDSPKKE